MDDRETAAPPVKKARSGQHVSLLQKEALVSFLEDHPALARPSSELGGTCSAHQRQSLWEEVANMLNCMGHATKEAAGWRRFWNDLVAQFKKDSAVVSDATTGTGGGKLPGLGGKVLSLIGRDCVVRCAPSLFLEVPTEMSENHASHTQAVLAVGERHSEALSNIARTLATLTAAAGRQLSDSEAGTANEDN
ncbi:hypothetical protein MTO96_045401 [Rhipicephalus appendiculatus]